MSAIVLTSETLIGTPATGNIEYNGQFFGTDSNASRAQLQRITSGTAVASTSGTSIDFTGLPAWVKRITVMFSAVSTNGTSGILIQLGVSGTPETTGYNGFSGMIFNTANTTRGISSTTGFPLYMQAATSIHGGAIAITAMGSNIWTAQGATSNTDSSAGAFSAGAKTLAGTLNMLRITTVNGTDTFDAGSINIMYEG